MRADTPPTSTEQSQIASGPCRGLPTTIVIRAEKLQLQATWSPCQRRHLLATGPGLANTHDPPATKQWSSTRPNPHISCCHVVHACACGSGHRQKGTCATSSDRCNPWNQTTFQVLPVAVRPVFDMCTVQCLSRTQIIQRARLGCLNSSTSTHGKEGPVI